MRSLTLIQPWATLIAIGAKRVETRSWRTSYRGPLVIHAGKKVERSCFDHPVFRRVLQEVNISSPDELPRGVALAVATLHACIPMEEVQHIPFREYHGGERWDFTEQERAFGDYSPGRYAWLLTDVKELHTPIPMKGALNLMHLSVDTMQQVWAQIAQPSAEEGIPTDA